MLLCLANYAMSIMAIQKDMQLIAMELKILKPLTFGYRITCKSLISRVTPSTWYWAEVVRCHSPRYVRRRKACT